MESYSLNKLLNKNKNIFERIHPIQIQAHQEIYIYKIFLPFNMQSSDRVRTEVILSSLPIR